MKDFHEIPEKNLQPEFHLKVNKKFKSLQMARNLRKLDKLESNGNLMQKYFQIKKA